MRTLLSRCAVGFACIAPMQARADNWLASIAQYRSDIIYQSIQQMTMVAIAGGLAAQPGIVWCHCGLRARSVGSNSY